MPDDQQLEPHSQIKVIIIKQLVKNADSKAGIRVAIKAPFGTFSGITEPIVLQVESGKNTTSLNIDTRPSILKLKFQSHQSCKTATI